MDTAEVYDSKFLRDIFWYLRERGQQMFSDVAKLVEGERRVLDAGCGEALVLPFLPKTTDYWGFDISPWVVEQNAQRHPKAIFGVGELDNPPFLGHFDAVLLLNVLHAVPDPEKTVRTCLRRYTPHLIVITDIVPSPIKSLAQTFGGTYELRHYELIDKFLPEIGEPEEINNRHFITIHGRT